MGKMYQVGELVVYGMHGVCRVVSEEERLVDKKRLNYLALEPLSNGNSRFLVPTQNAAAMAKLQPILSKEELEAMITSENVKTGEWIREENQRKQTYRELIGSGDRKKNHAHGTYTLPPQGRPERLWEKDSPVRRKFSPRRGEASDR